MRDVMSRISAGIVLYEKTGQDLRVLLIHPGGPYMKKKDVGHWSIPKGEVDEGEDLLTCARRELQEETGVNAGEGPFIPLGEIKQKGGKIVHAWGVEGRWNPDEFSSNTFEMEWPPQSGKMGVFPEVDRAEMLPLQAALYRIKETQMPLLTRLAEILGVPVAAV
jgi:predicted NUDIX family NTP pyrophosphohydrolase